MQKKYQTLPNTGQLQKARSGDRWRIITQISILLVLLHVNIINTLQINNPAININTLSPVYFQVRYITSNVKSLHIFNRQKGKYIIFAVYTVLSQQILTMKKLDILAESQTI